MSSGFSHTKVPILRSNSSQSIACVPSIVTYIDYMPSIIWWYYLCSWSWWWCSCSEEHLSWHYLASIYCFIVSCSLLIRNSNGASANTLYLSIACGLSVFIVFSMSANVYSFISSDIRSILFTRILSAYTNYLISKSASENFFSSNTIASELAIFLEKFKLSMTPIVWCKTTLEPMLSSTQKV